MDIRDRHVVQRRRKIRLLGVRRFFQVRRAALHALLKIRGRAIHVANDQRIEQSDLKVGHDSVAVKILGVLEFLFRKRVALLLKGLLSFR